MFSIQLSKLKRINITFLFIILIFTFISIDKTLYSEVTAFDYYKKGTVEMENKNFLNAISYYKQAIRKNQYYMSAFYNIGKAHYYLNNFEESLKYFLNAYKLDKENIKLLLWLGKTKTKLLDYLGAELYLHNAAKLDSRNYEIYSAFGDLASAQAKYHKAIKYYNEAKIS